MDLVHQFKDAIEILKLNKLKMAQVAGKKDSTLFGIGFLLVPGILNVILAALIFPSGFGGIFSKYLLWPIMIPALSFAATILLVSFVAEKVFHGQKDHVGFFRIMAYASVVLWVSVLPFFMGLIGLGVDAYSLFNLVGLAGGLYLLYVMYNVLMEHHKLNKEKAIYTIVAAFFISIIVSSILGNILVGSAYRFY